MHMRTSWVVPGRKDVLIIQPCFLEKHDGSYYLIKARRTAPVYSSAQFHRSGAMIPQAHILKAYGLFSENEVGSKRSVQTAQERLAENEQARVSDLVTRCLRPCFAPNSPLASLTDPGQLPHMRACADLLTTIT